MIEELQKGPKVTEVFPLSAPLCPIFIDSFAKLLLPIKMQSAPQSDCNQLSDTHTGVNEFCSLKQRPEEGEVEEEPLEGLRWCGLKPASGSHSLLQANLVVGHPTASHISSSLSELRAPPLHVPLHEPPFQLLFILSFNLMIFQSFR